jgi:hypothetical protein
MTDRQNSPPYQNGENPLESRRQRALDSITEAFAHDTLSLEEYEIIADRIQNAKSEGDIQNIVLPVPRTANGNTPSIHNDSINPLEPGYSRTPSTHSAYDEPNGASEFSLCVMGERHMTGDWLNSDKATSVTLMGSTVLDLRDVVLPPGKLKIDAVAIMGEVKVIVPSGIPVKMSAFPLMGEARVHGNVSQKIDRNKPWIEVSGIALMGSIVVVPAK